MFAQKHLSPPSGTTPSDVPALTPDHNASDEASTAPSTEQSTVPITALRTAPSATPHGLPSFSSDSTSLGSLLSPPTERFDISDPGHDHLTQPPDNISTTASDAEQLHPQELTDVNATPFRPIRPLPATATTTGTNKRPASSNPSLPQESLINKRLDHGNYNPQPLPQFAFQTPYMHYPPPPYFAYNGPFHPPPFYPNAFYPNPYGMTSAPSMYAGPYVPFTQAQSRTPLGEVSGNSMSRWREVKTEGKNVVVIDDDDSERDSKPRL